MIHNQVTLFTGANREQFSGSIRDIRKMKLYLHGPLLSKLPHHHPTDTFPSRDSSTQKDEDKTRAGSTQRKKKKIKEGESAKEENKEQDKERAQY